jgi:[NiFe] hydrogenase assembly HybE family chaperone
MNSLELLEPTFQMILEQKMEGIPVINDRLAVKAIGFHQWNDFQLGVLVTPWFMNLMLLPQLEEGYQPNIGSTQTYTFPSGAYDFIVGFEDKIGVYLSCSLFSPMFEFEDQEAAELTAEEVLSAIMNQDNIDIESQQRSKEIAEIWSGEKPAPEKTEEFTSRQDSVEKPEPELERKIFSERINEPTSRRNFLRGKVFTQDANK